MVMIMMTIGALSLRYLLWYLLFIKKILLLLPLLLAEYLILEPLIILLEIYQTLTCTLSTKVLIK